MSQQIEQSVWDHDDRKDPNSEEMPVSWSNIPEPITIVRGSNRNVNAFGNVMIPRDDISDTKKFQGDEHDAWIETDTVAEVKQ